MWFNLLIEQKISTKVSKQLFQILIKNNTDSDNHDKKKKRKVFGNFHKKKLYAIWS